MAIAGADYSGGAEMNVAPFLAGEVVTGVKILELVSEAPSMGATWYRVELGCCKKETQFSHAQIARRLIRGSRVCYDCAKLLTGTSLEKKALKMKARIVEIPDYGVMPPVWPVPESVPTGYWLWGR